MSLRFRIVILTVIISVIALGAIGYLVAREVSRRVTVQMRDKTLLTVSIFDADVEALEVILDSGQIQSRIDKLVKERPEIVGFTFNGPVYGEAEISGYRTLASSDPTLIWTELRPEVEKAIAEDEVVSSMTMSADGQSAVGLIVPMHIAGKTLAAVEVLAVIEPDGTEDVARDRAFWIASAIDASLDTTEDLLNTVGLQKTIADLVQGHPEIAAVSLHGPVYQQSPVLEYRKTASTDLQTVGELSELEAVAPITSDETVLTTVVMDGKEFLRVVAPIHVARKAVATVDVMVSLDQVRAETGRIARFSTLATLAAITLMIVLLVTLLDRAVIRPISRLTTSAQAMAAGDLLQEVSISSKDEVGILASAFNSMARQLRELIGSLEQQVAERTRELESATIDLSARSEVLENTLVELQKREQELEKAVRLQEEARRRQEEINRELQAANEAIRRRSAHLQATAEVSRAIAQVRDPDDLLPQVTRLISQHFGFYHVGIFLVDQAGRDAVLRAANSEGGGRMLARGHRLRVGKQGIVGYVTGTAQPRIALDVGIDAVYFDNPDLPETRSEMALPLRRGAQVIGALDVQSTEPGAFDDQDVAVLQTLADQVSIALENARLFTQAQNALAEAEAVHQRYLQHEWARYAQQARVLDHEYLLSGWESLAGQPLPAGDAALAKGVIVALSGDAGKGAALAVPIKQSDQVIGVLDLQEVDEDRQWTEEEIALVEAVAEQLSLALESARLFEQTQARARRESLTREITERIRDAMDVDTMLQTAIRELGQALGAPRVYVRLGVDAVEDAEMSTELSTGSSTLRQVPGPLGPQTQGKGLRMARAQAPAQRG